MAVRYTFDAERSRFTVQAFASGMLSGFAHSPTFAVRGFKGEMQFDPDAPGNASLLLEVRADSLELTDKVSEKDRQEIQRAMQEEVLETARYPLITYRSTQIAATRIADNWFRVQVRGEMRLHGATRPQEIDAQLRLAENELRLSGEFMLSQTAYGIKRASALGGAIKVKDELKFVFDLVGQKQEQAAT
jgi:polyisoprenoid-binding protein YceI